MRGTKLLQCHSALTGGCFLGLVASFLCTQISVGMAEKKYILIEVDTEDLTELFEAGAGSLKKEGGQDKVKGPKFTIRKHFIGIFFKYVCEK